MLKVSFDRFREPDGDDQIAECAQCGCDIYNGEIVIETLDGCLIHEDCLFGYLQGLGDELVRREIWRDEI